MKPHRERMVVKLNTVRIFNTRPLWDACIFEGNLDIISDIIFANYVFEDTGLPVGVEE